MFDQRSADVAAPPAPCSRAVQALRQALDAVVAEQAAGGLHDLGDVAVLARCAEAAQGVALRACAAAERERAYATVGCASTAGWLQQSLVLTSVAARARLRLGQRLSEDLRPLGDLLCAGGTTVEHCQSVVSGLRGVDPAVVQASLPALVTLAQALDPTSLARELRERAHATSDELAQEQARRQRQRVGLTLDELPDGCVLVRGLLAPEDGQAVLTVLDAVVHGRRDAGDLRDAPARRADALVALARHCLQCEGVDLPGQGGIRASVVVLVDADRMQGAPGAVPASFPASGALLTDDALLRLTCDADVSRAVLGSAADGHRVLLDLGRTTRTVSSAQHRALVARDRGCVVRGCHRRPAQCQAHHVRHWSRGGPSDLENYALLCHQHHCQVHDGGRWLEHRDRRWLTPDGYVALGPPLLAEVERGRT